MNDIHKCTPQNAQKLADWIGGRGGIAIWKSVNLSNPTGSWSSPANTDGKPTQKLNWQCDNVPTRIITNHADVAVEVPLEVKRFRVGIRRSSNGFALKVTDGGTRRIRAAVAKAASRRADNSAWYEFDYETQEAVIYVADKTVPLAEWIEKHQQEVPK